MASQHIYPATQTRLATGAEGLISDLWEVNESLNRLKAVADQISNGGDWTSLATEFGFGSAADAETFYNLLVAAQMYYQGLVEGGPNAVQYFMERMG